MGDWGWGIFVFECGVGELYVSGADGGRVQGCDVLATFLGD